MNTARSPKKLPARRESPAQITALIYGIVFLIVGMAGFIPGLTPNFESMSFGSPHSDAMLLGVFQVSILHNIVHLLYGILGLAFSRRQGGARVYLLVGGIVYLVLWVYGLIVDKESMANFVPLNSADDWLHLVLGVTMVGLAVLFRRSRVETDKASGAAH